MPPTDSFPWHCESCGRVNDSGQLTCTLCGKLQKSADPCWPPLALAQHPGKGRVSRRLLLICLSVSLVVILSGGGVFTYLSYTPFHTVHTFLMSNGISSLAWSPDSRAFAAVTWGEDYGSSSAMVNVWRTSDGQELLTSLFQPPPRGNSRLAWSPDGSDFAVAWDDGSVEIWEAQAGDGSSSWSQKASFHIGVHAANPYLTGFSWSADGKRLVVNYWDEGLYVYERDTLGWHRVQTPPVGIQMRSILAVSPNGTQAIGQQASATYAVWDVTTGKSMLLSSQDLTQADPQIQFAWSPDEHALAANYGGNVLIWQWNPQRKSWAFVRSLAVAPFTGIDALVWSPDNRRLATADSSNVIRLWSAFTGDLLGPFRLPLFDHSVSVNEALADQEVAITTLAWSPNGKYLLSGNYAGQVILQVVR
jgi:WD40 repeat protein